MNHIYGKLNFECSSRGVAFGSAKYTYAIPDMIQSNVARRGWFWYANSTKSSACPSSRLVSYLLYIIHSGGRRGQKITWRSSNDLSTSVICPSPCLTASS